MSNRRYLLVLAGLFALVWALLSIAPLDRPAWVIQNIAILAAVLALALTRRRFQFSRGAYTCIFAYLCLAEIASHYTYSRTPYDAWFAALTGRSLDELLGWERNNFDRIVHFAYGFLLVFPTREVFLRVVRVRGFWGYALPVDLIMSTSMLFELIEWSTAVLFAGGEPTYVGTQGDVWDAQKDMALASLGALLAMCIAAFVNSRASARRTRRDSEYERGAEPPSS